MEPHQLEGEEIFHNINTIREVNVVHNEKSVNDVHEITKGKNVIDVNINEVNVNDENKSPNIQARTWNGMDWNEAKSSLCAVLHQVKEFESREWTKEDLEEELLRVTAKHKEEVYEPCTVSSTVRPMNISVRTMIDSGSAVNIVDYHALEDWNKKARRQGKTIIALEPYNKNKLVGVGNHQVVIKGKCEFMINVGPLHICINAFVIPNAPTHILLGVPVMSQWGLLPDTTNKQLRFLSHPDEPINMKCASYGLHRYFAVSKNTVVIPPQHHAMVQLQPVGLPIKSLTDNHTVVATGVDNKFTSKIVVTNILRRQIDR